MTSNPWKRKNLKALEELTRRRGEALRLFRPYEAQTPFFRSTAREVLLRGGNRCQPADTEVWLSSGRITTLGKLQAGDVILGISESGKRQDIIPVRVEAIRRFQEKAYRLQTKRGYVTRGTHDHPVLACPPKAPGWHNGVDPDCKSRQWVRLSELQSGWFVRMAHGELTQSPEFDEQAYIHGIMDGDGSCDCYDYGVMKLAGHRDESLIDWMQSHLSSRGIYSRRYTRSENGVSLEWCNLDYKQEYQAWAPSWTRAQIAGYIRGIADAEGCVTSDRKVIIVGVDLDLGRRVHKWLLYLGVKASISVYEPQPQWNRPSRSFRIHIGGKAVRSFAMQVGFSEKRKAEKLNAIVGDLEEPTNRQWWDRVASVTAEDGQADIIGITTSSGTYISDGIVSHNSGKTLAGAARFAAIATDQPIYDHNDQPIDVRRPHQKGRPLLMWVIGHNIDHIGQTIYRLLFREGAFRVIRDEFTGAYRAFQPWDPEDAKRKSEAKMSPPFISNRFIRPNSWSWDDKRKRAFKRVEIWNPETEETLAEIYAFPSTGDVKAGDPVDIIWIDERIEYPEYYAEWQARLIDRAGNMYWTSWPDITNQALMQLTNDARDQEDNPRPTVQEFLLTMSGNPHHDDQTKQDAISRWSAEERMARDFGEYATDAMRMYPGFSRILHAAISEAPELDDRVGQILRQTGGEPPDNWTRGLVLDPGTTHPAVLFFAIPPPDVDWDCTVFYDEIDKARVDAVALARLVRAKAAGHHFEWFIIDPRAARQTPLGFGKTVGGNYADAFEQEGLYCRTSGSQFSPGSDAVASRITTLQSWMVIRPGGKPKMRVVMHRCPSLCRQFEQYTKLLKNGKVDDFKPAPRQNIDLAVCAEYCASRALSWTEPPPIGDIDKSPSHLLYLELRRKYYERKKPEDSAGVVLGPAWPQPSASWSN